MNPIPVLSGERRIDRGAPPDESPLGAALARLRERFDGDEAPLTLASVARVEIERDIEPPSFVVTVDAPVGTRWFRATADGATELAAHEDRALPLAQATAGATLLAWRPGRRIVLDDPGSAAVEKGYRAARFAAAAARHELVESLAGSSGDLVVPRLLALVTERASVRSERLAWTPFRLEPGSIEAFAAFGRALRAFQDRTPVSIRLPVATAASALDQLDDWQRRVERATALGEPVAGWRRGRAAAALRVPGMPGAPSTLAHGDLHDGQLGLVGGRPALVDFDQLALADPLADLGNLLAHLTLRHLQGFTGATADVVVAAERALVRGLGRETESGFAARLAYYRGTALLRLALVYRLRPRWWQLSPTLALEGVRCLES